MSIINLYSKFPDHAVLEICSNIVPDGQQIAYTYWMSSTEKKFQNELGNTIIIHTEEKNIAGQKGILFEIEGMDSSTTVHVTKREAEVLLEQLSAVLGN